MWDLYLSQDRFYPAELLLVGALHVRRETLRDNFHLHTLDLIASLVNGYVFPGCFGEGEPLYADAINIRRQMLGDSHQNTVRSIEFSADLFMQRDRFKKAGPLLVEALRANRATMRDRHPHTHTTISNVAFLYEMRVGRFDEGEPL